VEARFAALFQKNIATSDLAERKASYREMAETLNEECLVVWLPTILLRNPGERPLREHPPEPMPHRILWNSDRIYQKRPPSGRT